MKPTRTRGGLAVAGALSIAAVAPAMAQTPTPGDAPPAVSPATTGPSGATGPSGVTGPVAADPAGAGDPAPVPAPAPEPAPSVAPPAPAPDPPPALAPSGAPGPSGPTFPAGPRGRAGAPRAARRRAKARGTLSIGSARRNVTLGARALVTGSLRPASAGHRVQLQVRAGAGWKTVARDVTDGHGTWRLRFEPDRAAVLRARVAFAGDARTRAVARTVGTVNVFRRALASWYGPGLYGGHLACGGRLSPGTLGVAHKSLPCGTQVTLRHRGRSVRVPVVDRGPYVGAREFDLTSATRARLGFSGAGTILSTR